MDDKPINVMNVEGLGRNSSGQDGFKVFRYAAPKSINRDRAYVPLARSDIMLAVVQIFRNTGGEPQLHSHAALDGFWFVLKGRARFYGDNDVVAAELGEHEGIFIPRNTKYWFEPMGSEQLELLQVEAIDKQVPNTMTTYGPKKKSGPVEIYSPEGQLIAGNVDTTVER
jgi:mannose-6-phosphate isomerase-like protein (cupin superfamily)